jgi:hypothetical protein
MGEKDAVIVHTPPVGIVTVPSDTVMDRVGSLPHLLTVGHMGVPEIRLVTHPVVATLLEASPIGGWSASRVVVWNLCVVPGPVRASMLSAPLNKYIMVISYGLWDVN